MFTRQPGATRIHMKIAHMKLREVLHTHGYRLGIDSAREPAPGKALSPGGATTTAVEEVRNTQGNTRLFDYSPSGRKTEQASLIKRAHIDRAYVLDNGTGGGHSRSHQKGR